MHFLREWVFANWWLKLLALGLSFLLWTIYSTEPVAEVGYVVPIEFRNVPANLEISGDVPAQVHVRIRGRSIFVRRVAPADLAISVDLSRAQPGEATFHLTPDQVAAPYGVTVVGVVPSLIRVPLIPRRPSP
jgi:diadenylate cyclase